METRKMTLASNTEKMGLTYRFFCWCSGARMYILKQCPTDFNIFFGIGIIVFMTGILAAISGSYAFFSIFNDPWLALLFGFFWGLIIFFLDWYLVSSLRKENNLKKELAIATPRFILAVFIAVIIARPLELRLFEKEIKTQTQILVQGKKQLIKSGINEAFNEIETLKADNQRYYDQIKKLEDKRSNLFDLFIAEAEGRSPNGLVGKGPVYREKKLEYDKIESDLLKTKEIFEPLITANNKRIEALMQMKARQFDEGIQIYDNSDNEGFLSRLEAFSDLKKNNIRIALASWFIILLFICIEVSPIIVKLISERGPYDEFLDLERFNITSQARKDITASRNNMNRSIAVENEKYLMKLDAELKNNKEFIDAVMQAQLEIGKEKIRLWKEREMGKIESQLDNYQPTIDELINDARMNLKIN